MGSINMFVTLLCLMSILKFALGNKTNGTNTNTNTIGVITDNNSRNGKEEIVAIKMAFEDFYHNTNQSFGLHIRNSHGDPLQAVLAARDLIDTQHVEAIIGPQTWEETTLVAEICSQNMTPVLSLADATPPNWSTLKWPFLLQASPNQFKQMKAVAAIVHSYEWYDVNIIYEDKDSSSTRMLSHLYRALDQADVQISNVLAIPSLISLSQELERLIDGHCRVFVVNLSLPLAIDLFETAKKLNMMDKGYVWIITDPFTSLVHSLKASTVSSSMQGIIGVKSYFPEIGVQYEDFHLKFREKFSSENPHEFNNEPGIFAALAYDAAWTLAVAMSQTISKGGKFLLDKVLLNNFTGLSGKVQFTNQRLDPSDTFQIINVIGKGYKEIGFWSDGVGFSDDIGQNASFNSSMKELGQVLWPGRPWGNPTGWTQPTRDNMPLRIGIPVLASLKQFIHVIQDQTENTSTYQGFTIGLFTATMELLPYHVPFEFYPFNGTYDNLVKQVYLKNFDAVVDVTIMSYRYQYAEFTQPYTEPGVMMVVPLKSKVAHRAWLFMKPFTKTMWLIILAMVIYTGFILWILERHHHSPEVRGSMLNQTGTMAWLALTPLIKLDGDKLHSNLSKMVMVVWLFVALIITQTYTANLASMLTAERLEPTVDDIDQLRNSNTKVGYGTGSFLENYVHKVLQFHPENMRHFGALEEYAEAFRRKEIGAAFLEVPIAKIFLAKYCKEFVQAGSLDKTGGFGFAFSRGTPLLQIVNKALLDLFETGKVRELENKMLASEECEDKGQDGEEAGSLGPNSFWALFMFTTGTSTIALLVYVFRMIMLTVMRQTILRRLPMMIIQQCGHAKRRISRKISDVAESPMASPTTHATPTQV